ncbi:hypothetical protein [Marmoricola sp. Leaf446]|uniref:hypothetical protein n=1 Tax=Marmoricola sp. Leaf446 TaxID=1736379 RepID=UPI001910D0FA|nr:hypothetical protein [Marmoricola sp. Leaf446]
MPSHRHPTLTRLRERLARGPERRPWRHFVGTVVPADLGLRSGVFALGLALVLAGCALWIFSGLLTVPLVFAGLWVWSWEFAWARRLLHGFRSWVRSRVRGIRERPRRWAAMTVTTLAVTAGCYWAFLSYGPT